MLCRGFDSGITFRRRMGPLLLVAYRLRCFVQLVVLAIGLRMMLRFPCGRHVESSPSGRRLLQFQDPSAGWIAAVS